MRSRSHSRSVSDRRSFSRSPYKRNERRSYCRHRSNTRSRTSSSRPPSPPSMPVKGRYGRYSDSRSYSRSITPRYNSRYTKRRYDSRTPSRSRTRSRSISRHSDERYKRVTREKPPPSRCIGVFGLSVATTQQKIREIFAKYGPIERIQVVIDAQTGHSRGFCFIYYENLADAKTARHYCCGLEVDGRRIRVDYSITERPHTPTPGVYKGRPTRSRRDKYRSSSRRRSPSPYAKRSSHHSRRRYERSRSSSYSSRRFRY